MAGKEETHLYTPDNQRWPDDVSKTVAIMAPIPVRYFDPLDGLVNGVTDPEGFERYIQEWQADIVEILGPAFDEFPLGPPRFSYYPTLPAAGPYTDIIFTLVENAHTFIQSFEAYLAIGSALIELAKRRREREAPHVDEQAYWDRRPYLYSGLRGIEAMCLYHARQNYYDASVHPDIDVQSSTRGVRLGTAKLPTPDVQYTIDVRFGHDHFIYVIRADGRPLEHFAVLDGVLEGLDVPDWFEERSDWGQTGRAERAVPILKPTRNPS